MEVKEGVNIYSGSKNGPAASLTNPTELSFKKGNIKRHYPVELGGRRYRDAEAAFWKHAKDKKLSFGEQQKLCTEIITAKLEQYPELVEAINRRGGTAWLEKCRHFTGARSKTFKQWEGHGKKSVFIRCLINAYKRVK